MIVWLLRHGVAADPTPGQADAQRPLTAEGVERLRRAGKGYKRVVGGLDLLLASPLLRAQQTAQLFAKALHATVPIVTAPELVPDARPLAALERLQCELQAGRTDIACVGHEPQLGCLLGLLLTGSERAPIPLKRGMLVGVDVESSASMLGRLVFAASQRLATEL